MPTVSVVIPTYNRAGIICQSVKSVLNQTYLNFEIIVVDDCSNDNTGEVLRSLDDKRIRYIRHEKNKGAPAARNTGIRVALGEYIAFHDSDDEWLPEKMEKQMKVFSEAPKTVGVVYTAFLRVVEEKEEYIPYAWVDKKEGDIHRELLKGSFITTPSIMVRKECFEKVGTFDERLPRLQDYELVLRLSKYYDFRFIPEPLLKSPYMPDSLSSSESARIEALKIITAKHLDDFMEDKEALSKYYFGIGVHQCLNDETTDGNNYLVEGFRINPDRKLLSEKYFTIGRRQYFNQSNKAGRGYLIKAIQIDPLNMKVLLVLFMSFLGKGLYEKIQKLYEKRENDIC